MGLIRVVLADDVGRVRALLRDVLEDDGRFVVVGEAADGLEAISVAAREQPDAAVVDVSMPVMDGLEAVPRILSRSPRTRVVVFSSFSEREMAHRALAAGAAAYVEKGQCLSELARAISEVCSELGAEPAAAVAADQT